MLGLMKMFTNNYATLLPLENSKNLNIKESVFKNCEYYAHILLRMYETFPYLTQSLATLCHQEMGIFDVPNDCQPYLSSENDRILEKYCALSDLC